jgi:hypothetical protein
MAPQILADQLTLSQPGGSDYAHHINTGPPGFSDFHKYCPDLTLLNDVKQNVEDERNFCGLLRIAEL